jgi:hypothetical protein
MYCDCCGERLHEYPKDTQHPLCSACERGDCWETGH